MTMNSDGMSHHREASRAYIPLLRETFVLVEFCINPLHSFIELAPMAKARNFNA